MAKGKSSDFVEEAHEHAEHNINPYYWFNRVDRFQYAKWLSALAFSPIETLVLTIALVFTLVVIIIDKSLILFIFLFIPLFIFWFLSLIGTIKFFEMRRQLKNTQSFTKPKERKKKLPKRRKDYGRN